MYGEVIAFGKPFASYGGLNGQFDKCHHCFLLFASSPTVQSDQNSGRMALPLPCSTCAIAIYCSKACRTEARTYHRFECEHLLALAKLGPEAQLALRMLYSAGSLQVIKSVTTDWKDPKVKKCSIIKNSSDYALIYGLRLGDVHQKVAIGLTITAIFLSKLAQMSGFVSTGTRSCGSRISFFISPFPSFIGIFR